MGRGLVPGRGEWVIRGLQIRKQILRFLGAAEFGVHPGHTTGRVGERRQDLGGALLQELGVLQQFLAMEAVFADRGRDALESRLVQRRPFRQNFAASDDRRLVKRQRFRRPPGSVDDITEECPAGWQRGIQLAVSCGDRLAKATSASRNRPDCRSAWA